ncbi:MAG: phospho-N-acetylmuramoyl-pentapeptide-transferase [Sulfobacillus acidophilus]|uniref:Phospho-N-acetylmuramoyl-pentapeptide-transferase n=1 Tax=Sulfobacillus acidophilus TaxID=53633 RepID=A0A2T2WEJ5_9FIRM|nr:MAG: phospho-N-acetylmuramoyl-pentapeptide-transferase [Sulfobacillus acidophilus]
MKEVEAGILALVASFALTPAVLPILRKLKLGQQVRQEGPQAHLKKQGTPTMGGIIFLVAMVVAVAVFDRDSTRVWALTALTLGYGLIGFADDFLKVALHRPLGLRAREKLLLQVLLAVLFAWYVYRLVPAQGYVLPFHLGRLPLGWWYGPIAVLAILGAANAVNITDGLDGLAAGASVIAFAFFALLGLKVRDAPATVFALAMTGSLVGFMRANLHPAKVFMGDTGSLALGAALAGLAVVSGTVMLLPVVGVLFVIETLSVIIQVISFRTTGRRVFRMSPLHHHFELGGWSEERVVTVFWVVSALGAVLAWL